MNILENYLDKYDNGELDTIILSQYKNFGYTNEELYKFHLKFMLDNMYDIKLVEPKRKRLNQSEFRKLLFNKFNDKCIITEETCNEELTAAHIVPISEDENYDLDNGLLLRETVHRTFDKFKWSINPNTSIIEINKNVNVGEIKQYANKKIELDLENNKLLKSNLMWHYLQFKEKLI